jgi:phenylacetate-CoA ligase
MLTDAVTTLQMLRNARASTQWSADQRRSLQEATLKRLLFYAYERVPLYRRLYTEAGFHPSHFRRLEDLSLVPTLTKDRLQSAPVEETMAVYSRLDDCSTVATSGSTGRPLQIQLGRQERCWQRAVAWRILFEHGYRWTDRTLEIRMKPGPTYPIQRLGIAAKDWASILSPPSSWVALLTRRRHEVLIAGAGTLHDLATATATSGQKLSPPRIIISDSETLTAETRQLVRQTLGSDPVDVFGLVEVSDFAWQCEQRSGFHVSEASHVVEVDAPPGRPGPLLVSALGMWTTPIIRYETGDLAQWSSGGCACGRGLRCLSQLHGRAVDSIALPNGECLRWPAFPDVGQALPAHRDVRCLF